MFGAETLDHIGIPVRDLERSEQFYTETLGLPFLTRRKNADGSPRHTYVLAGENMIGLNLPGIQTPPSPSGAPRYAFALDSEERLLTTVERVQRSGVRCGEPMEHSPNSPFDRSLGFDDPDDNHLEICLSKSLKAVCLSHVVLETTDREKAIRFYTEALGLQPVGEERDEFLLRFRNQQLLGLKAVEELSERTKKHGRAVHVALNVTQEDYDRMVKLIEELGGRSRGDHRAEDGLRPPGERSLYFFDPDTNMLQITAHGEENWDLLPDEEKWRRIQESRAKRGRGISSFDVGKRSQPPGS